MAFDIGTLIRAAALGGGAYQQAQRDQEDRTRQQQIEDEERARRKAQDQRQLKADARAAAAEERDAITEALRQEGLRQEIKNYRPPEVPKPYRLNFRGVTNEYGSIDDLLKDQALLAASIPDPDAPRDTRLPHEVAQDELRRRILEAQASGAERDNEVQTAQPSDDMRVNAGVLLGTTGAKRVDPNDPMRDIDMRTLVQRNALIQSLIHEHGLTPAQAEREARRRGP